MSVQVIIKSSAQSVEDFTLNCEMTWTIAKVKDEISTLYPTKPKREHQKLIYGGKLLPDHLPLESVLNKIQDVHILHIVCPFSTVSDSTQKTNVNKEKSVPPICTAPPPNPTGVYPQMNPQILTPGLTNGIPGFVNGAAYNSVSDATQQYLAMQQMYTQFMTQYFAQYNGSVPYGQVNGNIVPMQPPQTVPRQNAAPNVPQQRPEEEQRDYIDYLYMFSRVAMLLALLLFYSSFSRVMAVFVMIILLTIFAKINKQHQREARRRANERQTAEAASAVRLPAEVPTTENEQASENSPPTETTPAEPPSPSQPATSVPSTIFTLVTAFFSSLIPTDPLPVNVN